MAIVSRLFAAQHLRKIVIVQTIALAATALLGFALKMNLVPDARLLHRSFATLAGLLALVTLIMAFIHTQKGSVKVLSVLTLLLIISAGIGGKMLTITAENYNHFYGQMIASGFAALILSIVLIFKVDVPSAV